MATEVTTSTKWTLDLRDAAKAAAILFFSSVITTIYTQISTPPIHVPTLADLKLDAIAGAIAALSYLFHRLITPSQIVITPTPPTAPPTN